MGLPCIATDICGCNEIVIDGLTGFLVEPRDADQLYNAMKCLADAPRMGKAMGLNARKHIIENFGQQRVWDAHLDFYRHVSGEN